MKIKTLKSQLTIGGEGIRNHCRPVKRIKREMLVSKEIDRNLKRNISEL